MYEVTNIILLSLKNFLKLKKLDNLFFYYNLKLNYEREVCHYW